MQPFMRALLPFLFLSFCGIGSAQTDVKVSAEREQMFRPYLATRHGGPDGLDALRQQNPAQYYRELWYYCESFYIRRNTSAQGVEMTERAIDVSRFESQRKWDEEVVIQWPGYKDALVLKAGKDLTFKPAYAK